MTPFFTAHRLSDRGGAIYGSARMHSWRTAGGSAGWRSRNGGTRRFVSAPDPDRSRGQRRGSPVRRPAIRGRARVGHFQNHCRPYTVDRPGGRSPAEDYAELHDRSGRSKQDSGWTWRVRRRLRRGEPHYPSCSCLLRPLNGGEHRYVPNDSRSSRRRHCSRARTFSTAAARTLSRRHHAAGTRLEIVGHTDIHGKAGSRDSHPTCECNVLTSVGRKPLRLLIRCGDTSWDINRALGPRTIALSDAPSHDSHRRTIAPLLLDYLRERRDRVDIHGNVPG